MSIGSNALNSQGVNDGSLRLIAPGGALISVEQTIGWIASGPLITLAQEVVLNTVASGALITVEQTVSATASGALIEVEQVIVDPLDIGNVARYGWDLIVIVGSQQIPFDQLTGTVSITRTESQASLCDVSMLLQPGVQDISQWHGKDIKVNLETASGIRRVYTGTVDIPEIDLLNNIIKLRCTDKRKEQINGQFASQLRFIGSWSGAIFDEPEDTAAELVQRLQTAPKAVDFDAFGNYTVSDILPKATPDFTLTDADIFRRNPSVEVASRGRIVNRINVDFDFQYVRLRHRVKNFQLNTPTFCQIVTSNDYSFIKTNTLESNIESGWPVKTGSISYTYLPDAGEYTCATPSGDMTFWWYPVRNDSTYGCKLDANGNTINDADGNCIIEQTSRGSTDFTKAFATEARWTGAKQFAQNITESIAIQVSAPQSITQYGLIEEGQKNGKRVEFDTAEFEKNEIYKAPDDNAIQSGSDWYLDKSGEFQEYSAAVNTAVNIAKTKIIKSHRANTIRFERDVWGEVDLKHTVQVSAGRVNAKGKVTKIAHSFDIMSRDAATKVEMQLSTAIGSQTNGSFVAPQLSAPLVGDVSTSTIKMYTHKNISTTSAIGASANSVKSAGIYTPAIDDLSRNEQIIDTAVTLDIAIQNDPLTVTFL